MQNNDYNKNLKNFARDLRKNGTKAEIRLWTKLLRDRQMLAEDGMFVIVATIDAKTGKLKKSPDIISRGFVYLKESQELLHEARQIVKTTHEENGSALGIVNFEATRSMLGDNLSKFLFQKTAKRPLVIPVLLAV